VAPPVAPAALVSDALHYEFVYSPPPPPPAADQLDGIAAAGVVDPDQEAAVFLDSAPVRRQPRRRPRNPAAWKRNNRVRRQFASPQPRCRCQWRCYETFTQQDRRNVHRRMTSCRTDAERKRLLANWITVEALRQQQQPAFAMNLQPRPAAGQRRPRRFTAKYYLPHPRRPTRKVRVCQSAFCSFFRVSRKVVGNLNAHRAEHGLMSIPVDMRGKHGKQVHPGSRGVIDNSTYIIYYIYKIYIYI
jgi:hypothetical protein